VPGGRPVTVTFSPGAEANGIGELGGPAREGRGVEVIVDDASIDASALVAAARSPARLVYQSAPLATTGGKGIPCGAYDLHRNEGIGSTATGTIRFTLLRGRQPSQ
jgi:hypothetical protein